MHLVYIFASQAPLLNNMAISTKEFKGQVGKKFRDNLKPYGFKGSGLNLYKETDDFLYSVFLSSSRFGDKFTLGLAVHPKQIKKNSLGQIDFDRLKNLLYEYKIVPWRTANGQWWDYDDNELTNLKTIGKVIDVIDKRINPTIDNFERTPNLLETIQPGDLTDFHSWFTDKTGTSIATTDIRFAWSLALIFETTDKKRSRSFAQYGLENSDKKSEFFGLEDFERIFSKSNGA